MPTVIALPGGAQPARPVAAEFFAGIGLVRLGLESAGFDVRWSNDVDKDKHAMYSGHFDEHNERHTFVLGDVGDVKGAHLPNDLMLAWASFPCTDLSLAGQRRGLAGIHSGTFWHFTRIIEELNIHRPPVIALENVVGLANSRGGDDLTAAVRALNDLGYSVDVLAIDARRFVPQSRPRLFLVGALEPPADDPDSGAELRPAWLEWIFGDSSLVTHRAALPKPPPLAAAGLSDIIEKIPAAEPAWWDDERTAAFIASLSPIQARRLDALRDGRSVSYRTAYRRTRNSLAVWEIRPDEISGCLRTARGGSSKQAVVMAGRGRVGVRWLTPREYARLMGAPHYRLEGLRRNQALFGFGDAVCVPVVAWLAEHYLLPLASGQLKQPSVHPQRAAAGA